MTIFSKKDNEHIKVGDIVEIIPISNSVKLAVRNFKNKGNKVIGVCIKIDNNDVYVEDKGIVDVNVVGTICLGDKLTISDIPGKAEALKYGSYEEVMFGKRSIGKVVGVYDVYDIAKVLLDIE